MNQDDVNEALKPLGDLLKTGAVRSIQFSITKNISSIEYCFSNGVTRYAVMTAINKLAEKEVIKSIKIFDMMLYRARIKNCGAVVPVLPNHENNNEQIPGSLNEKKTLEVEPDDKKTTQNEWFAINITRSPLIKRLTDNGFTPEQVKSWGCSNESQVSSYLTAQLMRNK